MKPIRVNNPLPRRDARRNTVGGAHQAVNQPRLPAQLGRHPAGRGGDVGKRQRQHQSPQQRAAAVQPRRATTTMRRAASARMSMRSQSHHDVIAVIEQRDVVRPLIAGKILQAFAPPLPSGGRSESSAPSAPRSDCPESACPCRAGPPATMGAPALVSNSPSMAASVTG